jgi:hypothetical protein
MINYFILALVATITMVVIDDDPTSVSMQEWALFGVLIYSAVSFFKRLFRQIRG